MLAQVDDIPTFSNCEDVGISDCSTPDLSSPINIYLQESPDPLATFIQKDYQLDCTASSDHYSLENQKYFSFIAYDDFIDIQIEISNCISTTSSGTSNPAGQFAVLSSCADYSSVMQFNFCGGTTFGDVDTTRSWDGFHKGCEYIVLLDGYTGSGCDFRITFLNYQPLALPQIECASITNLDCNLPNTDCDNPTTLCDSSSFNISLDEMSTWGCVNYIYTLSDAESTVIDTYSGPILNQMYSDFEAGTYHYEIEIEHLCDTLLIIDSFIVQGLEIINLPERFICREDINNFVWPANWTGHTHVLTPGIDSIFEYEHTSACQCNFLDRMRVQVSDFSELGVLDTIICGSFTNFNFNGNLITGPVTNFDVLLTDGSSVGCDSMARLNVYDPNYIPQFDFVSCDEDSVTIELILSDISAFVNSYEVTWWEGSTLIGTGTEITIHLNDFVDVFIEWNVDNAVPCTETILLNHQFVDPALGDLMTPGVECYSSNDTIIFTFLGTAFNNPALEINELSSYGFDVNGNQWIFTGLNDTDEVIIEMFADIPNVCSSAVETFNCSLDCVPYQFDFPQHDTTLCWSADMMPIQLEADVVPLLGTNASSNYFGGSHVSGTEFTPMNGVDSTYAIYFEVFEEDCDYLDSLFIHITHLPIISQTLSDTTICISESIKLDGFINFDSDILDLVATGDIDVVENDTDLNLELSWLTLELNRFNYMVKMEIAILK